MKLSVLTQHDDWQEYLARFKALDPYALFDIHSIYASHQNIESYLLVVESYDFLLALPFLKHPVPLSLTNHIQYFTAQSIYGFSGYFLTGRQNHYLPDALTLIEGWLSSQNIIAEFIRFSPLSNVGYSILTEHRYNISPNRLLPILQSFSFDELPIATECSMSRRAQRSGAKFSSLDSNDYLRFFDVYNKTMQINKASDFFFYSQDYFRSLFSSNGHDLDYRAFAVSCGKTLHAAAYFLLRGEFAVYHLGCNDRTIPGASDYLLRQSILQLLLNGIKFINLTGGRSKDKADKLFRFKSKFSNNTKEFCIGTRVLHPELYNLALCNYESSVHCGKIDKFIPW